MVWFTCQRQRSCVICRGTVLFFKKFPFSYANDRCQITNRFSLFQTENKRKKFKIRAFFNLATQCWIIWKWKNCVIDRVFFSENFEYLLVQIGSDSTELSQFLYLWQPSWITAPPILFFKFCISLREWYVLDCKSSFTFLTENKKKKNRNSRFF